MTRLKKSVSGSICGGWVQTSAGDEEVLSHIPQCRCIISVMLPNTQVYIYKQYPFQPWPILKILLHLEIDDIFLPDFKCSNKTVRRQYILNQVLKAKRNILVLFIITTTTLKTLLPLLTPTGALYVTNCHHLVGSTCPRHNFGFFTQPSAKVPQQSLWITTV